MASLFPGRKPRHLDIVPSPEHGAEHTSCNLQPLRRKRHLGGDPITVRAERIDVHHERVHIATGELEASIVTHELPCAGIAAVGEQKTCVFFCISETNRCVAKQSF